MYVFIFFFKYQLILFLPSGLRDEETARERTPIKEAQDS